MVKIKHMYEVNILESTLPIDSADMAPKETHTKEDYIWRENLVEGACVDAMDNTGKWWASTIITLESRKPTPAWPNHKVGFRQYTREGDKSDSKGSFFGFSDNLDERIGIYSLRLQKAGTRAD